jgi:cobalt-precorrin-5B (C1)-methyltransferase
MGRKRLKEGFTTGTAAAAAAKAALTLLVRGEEPSRVDVPLPVQGRLEIPLAGAALVDEGAEAWVVKDGGDDPDVTHRARIRALVQRNEAHGSAVVRIRGGRGVGTVTRPGLPVPVGEAAINPAPRRQIEAAVREVLDETGSTGEIVVTVEVENGEKIALKTLNPRLGILGGISILGTRGTVKPFSNKAYRDTITMSLDVARAQGADAAAFSTGGRSERLLRELRPDLPDGACIQIGDFFGFSLAEASMRGFGSILYSCFFGKLIKVAQGHPHTHARRSRIDFAGLSAWCRAAGLDQGAVEAVKGANTGRQALEIIRRDRAGPVLIERSLALAAGTARRFVKPEIELRFYLFDFDESLLAVRRDGPRHGGNTPHAS